MPESYDAVNFIRYHNFAEKRRNCDETHSELENF